MKNKEDIQFKKWKKSHALNEGFLDGEEEKPVKGHGQERPRGRRARQPGGEGVWRGAGRQQFPVLESGQES